MTVQNNRCARVTLFQTNPINTRGTKYATSSFDKNAPNALEITEDFCIEFDIEKTLEKKPNTATIKISNLAPSTRAFIAQSPLTLKLEAGYDHEYRHVFVGDVVRSFGVTKGATIETNILCGDGTRALRWARVNQAYRKGTPTIVALKFAAASMGIVLPDTVLADPELARPLPSGGDSLYGYARDELARMLAVYGYTFSIQNGQPAIIKDEQTIDNQAIVIDNDSWLIGSPEYQTPEKPGKPTMLKFESMLYPEIVPGKKVRIVSRSIDGVFKCSKVKHAGRTEDGGDFKSSIEAIVLADKVAA